MMNVVVYGGLVDVSYHIMAIDQVFLPH